MYGADLHYVVGDATDPQAPGEKIIAHVCNDYGGWGSGFVLALSAKWSEPERVYRQAAQIAAEKPLELGVVYMCLADESGFFVANMVAQHGNWTPGGPPAVDYKALRECLETVGAEANDMSVSVHMPRIGCGLGGGDWNVVEEIIYDHLVDRGIDAYVYDLPAQR
jgi:O-acetyl-ADP-ribose deacetylase (regulator of RNase III)